MRRILFAIAAVALFGLMACSGNESTGTITGPTAVSSDATSGPANYNPSMKFTADPKQTDQKSYWHGDTNPTVPVPSNGHPGHVSMTFNQKFLYGATLSWDASSNMNPRNCSITNNHDSEVIPVTNCDKGSVVVYPAQSTEYTFKYQYRDHMDWKWASEKETVTITSSISTPIDLRWDPQHPDYDKDDPAPGYNGGSSVYTGTATGSFSELQVDVNGSQRCGLGGGGTYNHLHATLAFKPPVSQPSDAVQPAPPDLSWSATYTGMTDVANKCTAAKGAVTLIVDPDPPKK